jgi:3D (Asp-Asp-Asp) domain-containing protein
MPPVVSTPLPGVSRARRITTAIAACAAVVTLLVAFLPIGVTGGPKPTAAAGVWWGGRDGVVAFGNAVLGTGPAGGSGPVTALAPTPSRDGYWVARSDGTVTAEGAAKAYGSAPLLHTPIVGMAPTPSGRGYWLAASDGGVFTYGDAPYLGAAAGRGLAAPIVAMAATPSGRGYVLVAADGGVFTFGDAPYLGAVAGRGLVAPIVGVATTPSGRGYWLAGADGGVFTFGDARYLGSRAAQPLAAPVTGIAPTASGRGYWLVAADGGVFTYGDAPFLGSLQVDPVLAPTTAIAASPGGGGYWEAVSPTLMRPLGTFIATCYTGGITTATGTRPSTQVVAVDPGVIPLGSRVFIPGIGVRTAADTGGAIRGARVDIWQPSYSQCVQFGAQRVEVYLLR